MSYIYALYFVEQNAVKIGKANDLFTRWSDLVSTWGNIDPYRAKAWELDELLVLGGEKQLHNEFQQYQKPMPEGDGSTEFFEPNVWELLSPSPKHALSKKSSVPIDRHRKPAHVSHENGFQKRQNSCPYYTAQTRVSKTRYYIT